jgi:hypothetical protein
MWDVDFIGVADDRSFTPQEYDSLADRVYSALINGGDVQRAVIELDALLRREWGSQVSRSDRSTLESRIGAILARTGGPRAGWRGSDGSDRSR